MSSVERVFAFLRQIVTRQNLAHLSFLGGIGVLAFGANQLGLSLGFEGLGAICGGLALIVYAYLLGAE